jgi:hypothetical protein
MRTAERTQVDEPRLLEVSVRPVRHHPRDRFTAWSEIGKPARSLQHFAGRKGPIFRKRLGELSYHGTVDPEMQIACG